MPRPSSRPEASPAPPAPGAGADLRERVEALGVELARTLGRVLDGLPRRPAGPQVVADVLGITVVTASRLLKALAQPDPVAILQGLPGPNPLRRVVEAAREQGAPGASCDEALEAVGEFDDLIRNVAGDRGSLKAMLTAWLPDERREFEAQRRQQIYKALTELEGVSAELEISCLIVAPSRTPERMSILDVKCLLGIDRIRPDAVVNLGTQRMPSSDGDLPPVGPRAPLTLDGRAADEGLNDVRLDEYCHAPPAPLVVRKDGNHVVYSLGATGFGPHSRVDLVLAELNLDEPLPPVPSRERPPYFFALPELPSRRLVFDLLVHRDLYPGTDPTLLTYTTTGRGPAIALDPGRELDRRTFHEGWTHLGEGLRRTRLLEFPRYTELVAHVLESQGWDPEDFRGYRVNQAYPLVGFQTTLAFLPDEA